jgi:hypothetical protein
MNNAADDAFEDHWINTKSIDPSYGSIRAYSRHITNDNQKAENKISKIHEISMGPCNSDSK